MSYPEPHRYLSFHAADFKGVSEGWENHAEAIGRISDRTRHLRLAGPSWIFAPFVWQYEQTIMMVDRMATQGRKRMAEIALTLTEMSKTYTNAESETKRHIEAHIRHTENELYSTLLLLRQNQFEGARWRRHQQAVRASII